MVRGWLLSSGAVLLLLPGAGERSRHSIQRDRKRGRDYCPKLLAASCLRRPSRLPKSARSPQPRSPGREARPRPGTGTVGSQVPGSIGSLWAPRVACALSVPLLFSWAPRNLQLPRFHRPRLPPRPPPPRFSAMQLQGSLFPRLRIRTPPDSEGRWRAGGGGVEEEGAGLGQVSVLAAAGSPNVNPAARCPWWGEAGWGGEA